jgi:CBS domain-containing protein
MVWHARDVMETKVKTVDAELTLADLERVLLAERISGAPVVAQGKLVGIVSRSDIVRQISVERTLADVVQDFYRDVSRPTESAADETARTSESVAKRLATLRVKDAMIKTLITVAPDEPLEGVARRMVDRRIHRILVTEDEKLVGIISTLDLIRLFAEGKVS